MCVHVCHVSLLTSAVWSPVAYYASTIPFHSRCVSCHCNSLACVRECVCPYLRCKYFPWLGQAILSRVTDGFVIHFQKVLVVAVQRLKEIVFCLHASRETRALTIETQNSSFHKVVLYSDRFSRGQDVFGGEHDLYLVGISLACATARTSSLPQRWHSMSREWVSLVGDRTAKVSVFCRPPAHRALDPFGPPTGGHPLGRKTYVVFSGCSRLGPGHLPASPTSRPGFREGGGMSGQRKTRSKFFDIIRGLSGVTLPAA